jgi:uncharacterized protein YecT (DUF1311 family)
MPADDRSATGPVTHGFGFSSYSDDTPRYSRVEPERASRAAPPLEPQMTMLEPPEEPARRLRAWPGIAIGLVLVAAIASGVGLTRLSRRAPSADQEEASVVPRLQVVTGAMPTPAAPQPEPAAANLPPPNSLPAGVSAPPQFETALRAPPPPVLALQGAPRPRDPPAPPAPVEPAPPPPIRAAPPVVMADARTPASPCDGLRSYAEQMVCSDPQLGAADRRLRRAFGAALRSGVPEDELRADQDEWLRIREGAARYSRNALMNVYHQRIDELESAAAEGPD